MAGDTDGDWAGVARMAFLTALRWLMRDFFSTDMAFLLFRLVSVWTECKRMAKPQVIVNLPEKCSVCRGLRVPPKQIHR